MNGRRFVHPISEGDYVQSLDKGLAVISAFSGERRSMTLSQVAAVTGLSKPSARRCLLTLHALGYLVSEGTSFRLGPKVLDLAQAYLSSVELPAIVEPFLNELNADLQEACSVGVLDGDSVVYVARAQAKRVMTIAVRVGTRIDPFVTALGRVLLAYESEERIEKLWNARTDAQSTVGLDLPGFLTMLREVRQQSWCLVDQEVEVGVRTIAVPIRDGRGKVIAGMNVAVHTARVSIEQLESEFLQRLQRAREDVETCLREYGPEMTFY
ncbi:IclR family transcriptional regulator domain-containing protein [Nocardia higoensis]|uniref:IclR family transcriptional regulator domain-containing protein n=1 Tax=Nocardia higoensis TaxID=228599 RepID=UPI0002D33D77|nr:IclR family transcriptional regulator C-terminal domain-containing protein [Nocardia higoensis]